MRFAAFAGDDLGVNDRGLAGDALPRAVGMPRQRALVGMLAVRVAVRIEVGEAVQLRIAIGVVLVHHVDLHLAEMAGEFHLAPRRQFLRAEQQHLISQERLVNRSECLIVHAIAPDPRR